MDFVVSDSMDSSHFLIIYIYIVVVFFKEQKKERKISPGLSAELMTVWFIKEQYRINQGQTGVQRTQELAKF